MKHVLIGAALAGAFALIVVAADIPPLNDEALTGDPLFLARMDGKPLLNGKEPRRMAACRSQQTRQMAGNQRPSCGAALRTRRCSPECLLPATALVNTDVVPSGNASNIYTTEKFGDVEVVRRVHDRGHSNSGFFLHGLYETQIWDSWGFVPRLMTDQCGSMYHYNGGPT